MSVIVVAVVVLTIFGIGVLIGTSLTHHWMGRRIHMIGAERRELSEERADVVDAWTELAEQRRELELLKRTIDS